MPDAAPGITRNVTSWPSPDRQLWAKALARGDLLDEPARPHGWRPATLETLSYHYCYWLRFLQNAGGLEDGVRPDLRANAASVGGFVAGLQARGLAPHTVASYVCGLYSALALLVPSADLAWLSRVVCKLTVRARRTRSKLQLRSSRLLLDLGMRLMARAAGVGISRSPLKRAVLYRTGLAIALLAARPVRGRNFAEIQIGRNLRRTEDGWQLVFAPEETKTKRPWEASIPDILVPHLEHYLAVHRPRLLRGRSSAALWISGNGRPWTRHCLWFAVTRATERKLGVHINPHLFRDASATSFAIEDPEHVRASAVLLGHARLETTERSYNQARSIDASRKHLRAVKKLRKRLTRKAKRRRPAPIMNS